MLIVDLIITVAPMLGFFSQYFLILNNKSIGAFSIDGCAISIISNILRICFWFATGFANNLLIQSFLNIALQFMMLNLCLQLGCNNSYEENNQLQQQIFIEQKICTLPKETFWRWKRLTPFILFTIFFALFMACITFFFVSFKISFYGSIIGYMALSIEAFGAFPQLIKNQNIKSVQGLSTFMVMSWFIGDFVKTLYFIIYIQPMPFILCGSIQLTVDVIIIIQVMAFCEQNISYTEVNQTIHENQNHLNQKLEIK